MNGLRILTEQLIFENPSGLRKLLFEYSGYTGPLDFDAIFSAYVLYGDGFLWDLHRLFSYDHADGQTQNDSFKNFSDFWADASSVITGISAIGAAALQPTKPDPAEESQRKLWKGFLICGSAFLLLLVIVVFFVKRS